MWTNSVVLAPTSSPLQTTSSTLMSSSSTPTKNGKFWTFSVVNPFWNNYFWKAFRQLCFFKISFSNLANLFPPFTIWAFFFCVWQIISAFSEYLFALYASHDLFTFNFGVVAKIRRQFFYKLITISVRWLGKNEYFRWRGWNEYWCNCWHCHWSGVSCCYCCCCYFLLEIKAK